MDYLVDNWILGGLFNLRKVNLLLGSKEGNGGKGGRGEIPWYHIPKDTAQAGELEVRQSKVSAPLAYAVCLINDNMANPLFHFKITPNTHEMCINSQFR